MLLEGDNTLNQRIDRIIAPKANVVARFDLCAALANDDRPRLDALTAKALDTQHFRVAVAPVA